MTSSLTFGGSGSFSGGFGGGGGAGGLAGDLGQIAKSYLGTDETGALADVDLGVPVWSPLDAATARIQSALQAEFDPDGVFNTGRQQNPA